jgi:fatty acid desaturase
MNPVPSPAEQTLPERHNLFKAILLPLLLLASFHLAQRLAEPFAGTGLPWWVWGLLLLLAVCNCVIVIGMGILAHEAVHRVLFHRRWANELIGGLLSALALIPFYANRQFHLTHHSYAHQPDRDPEQVMHDRAFPLALTHGSVVALQLQYRILFANLLQRFEESRYRNRALADLALVACAMFCYLGLVPAMGIDPVFSLLPTLLLLPLVFGYRALSDHYGIPPVQRRSEQGEARLEVSGPAWAAGQRHARRPVSAWVILTNPWLEWMWSHVNYHEVHHKFPWLAHVHLKPVFEATRDELPYLVAKGYTANLLRLARLSYYGVQRGNTVEDATDAANLALQLHTSDRTGADSHSAETPRPDRT